jgi:hypothetical protein
MSMSRSSWLVKSGVTFREQHLREKRSRDFSARNIERENIVSKKRDIFQAKALRHLHRSK